jgi:hypothetical protein
MVVREITTGNTVYRPLPETHTLTPGSYTLATASDTAMEVSHVSGRLHEQEVSCQMNVPSSLVVVAVGKFR